jgi:hypothetical protein
MTPSIGRPLLTSAVTNQMHVRLGAIYPKQRRPRDGDPADELRRHLKRPPVIHGRLDAFPDLIGLFTFGESERNREGPSDFLGDACIFCWIEKPEPVSFEKGTRL